MTTPLSNRPKITQNDILQGYVIRYFVQNVSIPNIIEIDKKQYDVIKKDPYYKAIEIKWVIVGFANDITATDGKTIYGTKHQNEITVNWYNTKMPGLNRVLVNPLEYFQGVDNRTQ